jgi:dynein heavy chain, axonemal
MNPTIHCQAIHFESCNPCFAAEHVRQAHEEQQYREVVDQARLAATVKDFLADYDAQNNARLELVVFHYVLQHVARISRIIKQPQGHALLVGPVAP